MQDADHVCRSCIADEPSGVVLRVTGVHNERLPHFVRELHLCRERRALGVSWRVVVVVIETALTDCDRRVSQRLSQFRQIPRRIKGDRVVGVNARGSKHKARVVGSDLARDFRRRERLSDADDSSRARVAGAGYYLVAVTGERRVRDVGVAVDEDGRMPVARGHLRSIQRSTGAAT